MLRDNPTKGKNASYSSDLTFVQAVVVCFLSIGGKTSKSKSSSLSRSLESLGKESDDSKVSGND